MQMKVFDETVWNAFSGASMFPEADGPEAEPLYGECVVDGVPCCVIVCSDGIQIISAADDDKMWNKEITFATQEQARRYMASIPMELDEADLYDVYYFETIN